MSGGTSAGGGKGIVKRHLAGRRTAAQTSFGTGMGHDLDFTVMSVDLYALHGRAMAMLCLTEYHRIVLMYAVFRPYRAV